MTVFYLIRHGEPTYEFVEERGFIGLGRALAQLTEEGVRQITETSKDERLKLCDLIIASPYTRALQSAAILSRELGIELHVEVDLHEWLPDKVYFQYKTRDDCRKLKEDYLLHNGKYPENQTKVWETTESMKKRMESVLNKYLAYSKVIVVCHSMVMEALTGYKNICFGQIIEYVVDSE